MEDINFLKPKYFMYITPILPPQQYVVKYRKQLKYNNALFSELKYQQHQFFCEFWSKSQSFFFWKRMVF